MSKFDRVCFWCICAWLLSLVLCGIFGCGEPNKTVKFLHNGNMYTGVVNGEYYTQTGTSQKWYYDIKCIDKNGECFYVSVLQDNVINEDLK